MNWFFGEFFLEKNFKGLKVPKILLSGDHKKIDEWRKEKVIEITKKNRPDLIK